MGSRPERGAYGNARGKPDKQVRARRNRDESPRHQAAREEVERNNAELARLERESAVRAANTPYPNRSAATGTSMTTIRERMDEKHKVAMAEAAEKAEVASPSAVPAKGRFAPCHCSHAGHPEVVCTMCICDKYRPVTAPDPQAEKRVVIPADVNELLLEGKNSAFSATVDLATRIEGMLVKLKQAVLDEDRKAAEERARQAAQQKVRDRMAELEAEMERLRAELIEPPKAKRPGGAGGKRKPYDGPPLVCPECGRDDFKGPQGKAAHRRSEHGVAGSAHK